LAAVRADRILIDTTKKGRDAMFPTLTGTLLAALIATPPVQHLRGSQLEFAASPFSTSIIAPRAPVRASPQLVLQMAGMNDALEGIGEQLRGMERDQEKSNRLLEDELRRQALEEAMKTPQQQTPVDRQLGGPSSRLQPKR
jgi:hypothetical protein